MDKEEIEYTAQALLLLGKQEQEIIRTFESRMQTWYPHRKYVLSLLAESKTGGDVKSAISRIRSEIFPIFKNVDYVAKEEEAVKKELVQLSVGESILQKEVAEAQQAYAQGKFGEEAKHKVAVFLQKTEELLKHQVREKSLSDQLRSAVKQLGPVIQQELGLIDEEEKKLSNLELAQDKNERVKLADEIVQIVSSLQVALFKEKNVVIDPINSVLRIKLDVASKVRALISERQLSKSRITVDDIKTDIRRLTKPDEITEYSLLVQRHPRLSDDKCKSLLSKVGVQSFSHVKESFFERAWESITDGMTGIFNKTFYMNKIKEMVREAQELGDEISVVVFDLDKFKLINDNYNHQMGDEALIEVVNILSSKKERRDPLFRYGGEEFVLIVRAPIAARFAMADRLRRAVEMISARFVQEKKITDRPAMTVSVGVASFKGTHEHVPDSVIDDASKLVFALADRALYNAKEAGRNRVFVSHVVIIRDNEPMVGEIEREEITARIFSSEEVRSLKEKPQKAA
jgi:diguanylate cyclase (GGDEF)-like protein